MKQAHGYDKLTLGFFDNYLSVRGTTNAIAEYSRFHGLKNKGRCVVFYIDSNPHNDEDVVANLREYASVVPLSSISELESKTRQLGIDILYVPVSAPSMFTVSLSCPVMLHCIFDYEDSPPIFNRTAFVAVSPFIKNTNPHCLVLPHIIRKPRITGHGIARRDLGLNDTDLVIGRIGAYETFDIQSNVQAILKAVDSRDDLCFLMVNTKPFEVPSRHKSRIKFLPRIADAEEKYQVISMCDCMLWGGSMGETFGIAIGEFCAMNKPILCCASGSSIAHIHYVGELGITYSSIPFYYNQIACYAKLWLSAGRVSDLRFALFYIREFILNCIAKPSSISAPLLTTVLTGLKKETLQKMAKANLSRVYYHKCDDATVMSGFYDICQKLIGY